MTDYLAVNRDAYDALSSEYAARSHEYALRDIFLMAPLLVYLKKAFQYSQVRILDIGPGSGLNMKICQEHGFSVVGVDISPKIVGNLSRSLPSSELILGDFLTADIPGSFHGVISKASLHLFPKEDGLKYLQKIDALLLPSGMAYISVTASEVSTEGFSQKTDYSGNVVRFKKSWTKSELLLGVWEAGLTVAFENFEAESTRGKSWLNVYAIKS